MLLIINEKKEILNVNIQFGNIKNSLGYLFFYFKLKLLHFYLKIYTNYKNIMKINEFKYSYLYSK